jgi:hypothetical protein
MHTQQNDGDRKMKEKLVEIIDNVQKYCSQRKQLLQS